MILYKIINEINSIYPSLLFLGGFPLAL